MAYKVYKLTSPSNKVYIGITSQPIKRRWKYGNGYKGCTLLDRAIKKYGWDNFKKEILLNNTTESEAKSLEVMLIKIHRSNDPQYGYNLTEGGDGAKGVKRTEAQKEYLRQINLGKHHSEETKKKMSASHKGKKFPNRKRVLSDEERKRLSDNFMGSNNPLARKVICLETLRVYDTMTQAKEETGSTKITECCKHYYKHKSSNGLHWEYYDASLTGDDYKEILKRLIKEEEENKHHKPSLKNIKGTIERSSVPIMCVETKIVYSSIAEACRIHKISNANLCNCCKGKRKTAGGFHWRYVSSKE